MNNVFQEPTWVTPEIVPGLNRYMWKDLTIQDLTGVILRLIQAHFANAWQIMNPKLRTYLWSKGGAILDVLPGYETKDTTRAQCTIIVQRNQTEEGLKDLQRYGIRVSGGSYSTGSEEGRSDHWTFLKIPYTVICEASSGAESEALAEEVHRWLMRYGPRLREEFRLYSVDPGPLGETKKNPERGNNVYQTPVIVVCWVHKAWSIQSQTVY